jgi:hypothetical protein
MKRTFEDRMINDEDIGVFRNFLVDGCKNYLCEVTEANNPVAEPLIFTQFIQLHLGLEPSFIQTDMVNLK